jgi:hypothetical protein
MTNRRVMFLIGAVVMLLVLLVPVVAMAAPLDQPQVPHPIAGREACTSCHQVGGAAPTGLSASHQGRTDATCLTCHTVAAAAAATPTAAATAAATETAAATATSAASETAAASATTAASGSQLPASGAPLPMLIPAIVAGASLVSGLGIKLLKK